MDFKNTFKDSGLERQHAFYCSCVKIVGISCSFKFCGKNQGILNGLLSEQLLKIILSIYCLILTVTC